MGNQPLIYSVNDGIGTLTLNRPDKLNAINAELENDLIERFKEIEHDRSISVVVIRGSGRAFCSGADMSGDTELGTEDVQGWRRAFLRTHRLLNAMVQLPKPVIAATHGYALGMGFYIATASDMIISTMDCKFGVPEIRHGQSSTGWVPVWNVSRNIMMELLLTGDMIDGSRAEEIGLVNRAVPAEKLDSEVERLSRKLALIDPTVLAINKATINFWYSMVNQEIASLYSVETNSVINVSEPRKRWDKIYRKEGIRGFLKKRDEPFNKIDREAKL